MWKKNLVRKRNIAVMICCMACCLAACFAFLTSGSLKVRGADGEHTVTFVPGAEGSEEGTCYFDGDTTAIFSCTSVTENDTHSLVLHQYTGTAKKVTVPAVAKEAVSAESTPATQTTEVVGGTEEIAAAEASEPVTYSIKVQRTSVANEISQNTVFCNSPNLDVLIFEKVNGQKVKLLDTEQDQNGYNTCFGLFAGNSSSGTRFHSIRKLDLTGLELVSNTVKTASKMFYKSDKLLLLEVDSSFVGIDNASNMFEGCTNLKGVDLSGFNMQGTLVLDSMFEGCKDLRSVDFKSKCSPSTTVGMFKNCTSLEDIDIYSIINFTNVTNVSEMFRGCSNLVSIGYNDYGEGNQIFFGSSMTDASYAFAGCTSIKMLSLRASTGTSANNLNSMAHMYDGCKALVYLSINVTCNNLNNTSFMLNDCSQLKYFEWNLSTTDGAMISMTDASSMFCGCSALESLDLGLWIIKNKLEKFQVRGRRIGAISHN